MAQGADDQVAAPTGADPTGIDLTDLDRFTHGFPHEVFSRLRRDAPVHFLPHRV